MNTTEYITHKNALFTSFRLAYTTNDAVNFTHRKVTAKHDGSNGTASYNAITETNASFAADGTTRNVEVFCNNSANPQYYVVNDEIKTVASQTAHLWMDGNEIGVYSIADAGQEPLATGLQLDAFMVYTHASGTGTTEIGYGSIELSNFKVDYVTTTSATLPVSLTDFKGVYDGNAVKLSWKTLSEKDNSHFAVLRSADGVTFNEIRTTPGKGNSTEVVNYAETDYSPLAGVNYYQLKQVDNNGQYALSEVIAVNTSLADNALKVVNKDGALTVSLYSAKAAAVDINITDINGRKLYSQKVQAAVGNNQFDIAALSLAHGIYILSVEGNGEAQRVKFIN